MTISIVILLSLGMLYGLLSISWLNNTYTEHQRKSIKTLLHQYYVGRIIDNNVGRFIKLREHRPNTTRFERPSRRYIANIVPGSVERKYYKITTDQHGFIAPSEIHENPEIKIVFLGGSTTECLYMEETERFPYRVGRQLETLLNVKINAYNGGVSANESMHSFNILINKVLPLMPTVVVWMHNINDLVILRSQGSYGYTDSLKSHVQTSKNVFTRYEFPPRDVVVTPTEIEQAFRKNIKMFIAVARIHAIMPVLMTQANRVENDPLYHRLNDVIREVGNEQQVKVIDLARDIPPTTDNLYDSYHYTAKGSQAAAMIISKELVKEVKEWIAPRYASVVAVVDR